jgi:hypothetical protein
VTDLNTALYKGITHRARATEGRSVAGMVRELERTHGTRPPEGISADTWRRLRKDPGRRIADLTRAVLWAAQRRARLTAAREKTLRSPWPKIEVRADVQFSNGIQYDRWLHVGTWRDTPGRGAPYLDGMLRRVLDAWLAGGDDEASARFLAPIRHHLNHDVILLDVHEVVLGRGPKRRG